MILPCSVGSPSYEIVGDSITHAVRDNQAAIASHATQARVAPKCLLRTTGNLATDGSA